MTYGPAFVCLFGMGTVFAGLICIIILTSIMGKIVGSLSGKTETAAPAAAPVAQAASNEIPNRQALIAAISCVLAEEMGTDVTGIRIHSLKKI
ncbi:MAG: OadG family protein [Oscillospiraceae bacterium]|nr:OadG family protein [Oscillospiraceae bacterium]